MPRRTIDIAFARRRIAVFVDGCFWHRCPQHSKEPRSNAAYWRPKLLQNVSRDRETDAVLRGQGWSVVRLWEHEPLQEMVDRVIAELSRATSTPLE